MLLQQQTAAGSTAAASAAAGAATTASTAAAAVVHKNILLEFETASAERRAAIVLAELLRLMGSYNSRTAAVSFNTVTGMRCTMLCYVDELYSRFVGNYLLEVHTTIATVGQYSLKVVAVQLLAVYQYDDLYTCATILNFYLYCAIITKQQQAVSYYHVVVYNQSLNYYYQYLWHLQ
jgi:hypothetical protein